MGARRKSREIVLQTLYFVDNLSFNKEESWKKVTSKFKAGRTVLDYSNLLYKGIKEKEKEIDRKINKYAKDWKIERMNIVDKNIMRIAIYEMLYVEEIPYRVAIDEALELAKKYSTDRAKKFINGILDKVAKEKKLEK